ncbi:MAG: hypothetical protein CMI01_12000 [Oceanospirillaceae bacterium]|nr:hypothetical protein [Oceanospirillaceae bacterium]
MRRQIGFTLIELMIALVVLAVLAVVGAPAMSSFFEKRRVTDAAMAVYSQLQLARSTAIARSENIVFEVRVSDAGVWTTGFTDKVGCDSSISDVTDASACTVEIDTNLDGTMDGNELHRLSGADFAGVTFSTTDDGYAGDTRRWQLEFDAMRGIVGSSTGTTDATWTSDGGSAFNMTVDVLPLGQVKVCSSNMPGYGGC